MSKNKQNTDQFQQRLQQLCAEAERRLAELSTASTPEPHAATELLHELQIHQIELEMQNEELRRVHIELEASRDRYVDLYDFAPIGYLSISTEGIITEANLKAATMLDVTRRKLMRKRFAQFVADQDKDRWYRLFQGMMKEVDGEKHCFDLLLMRGDGSMFHAHFDCLRRVDDAAIPTLRIALIDITAIKLAETELRIAAIAFESQDSILITDANNMILKVNQAFCNTTGYTAKELIGQTPRLIKSGYHNKAFYKAMWDSIRRTGIWQGEIRDRRKNGQNYTRWLTITAVKDHQGAITHYVGIHTDITERKEAEDKIMQLAFYDVLTQLPNRRLLMRRLQQGLAASARRRLIGALLFIDLDNFKTLNDTLGHNHGDLLLQQVAQRLAAGMREDDTVARLGGDEFVVMLENLSKDMEEAAVQAKTAGEKVLAIFAEAYQLDGYEYHSTPSIGVVLFNGQQYSVDELLKRADIAMYQAKAAGRNTLRFFDPKMQAEVEARASLERDLSLALNDRQFQLYYQKQVTHDGLTVGAEVLIRWRHPERGLISPQDFIPLAEETGLILPIGQWVLETACAQLKKWADNPATNPLQLAINVSSRQFYQADFVRQILAVIKHTGINPDKLKLELTESVVLGNIADTIVKMNALKKIGVHFSMDDFGTGYSSLSYLTQLPLDQLKIDQSFVRNIGVKPSDAAIVQTIIGMTKNLGIEVIAEGVETEEQRDFLEQHGCPLYQGYLFSKPVPLDEFERLLSC